MSDLINGVEQKAMLHRSRYAIAFLLAEGDRLFEYINILVTLVAKINEYV
ncbi:MAG: hypothetical protein MET45_26675 [Nostoc sp. LLA-1]|nr:hypothetical protein [Cyanocohniella sp. LLY]